MANVIKNNTIDEFVDQIIIIVKNLDYFKKNDCNKKSRYFDKYGQFQSLLYKFMHTLGVGESVELSVHANAQMTKIKKIL